MKRSKHSLSHYKLASMDMGELVPVGCYEVLPGDTVQQATSALLRVSPLLAPVMHPVSVRIHHWFVPNRLIWEDWEEFITGGTDGEGDGSEWPYMALGGVNLAIGSLADYLGVAAGTALPATFNVSALPFRAYQLIYNEYYRDQDLITPAGINLASGNDGGVTSTSLQKVSWEKDIFTTARPWPQKGPDVTLPLGTSATVRTTAGELVSGTQAGLRVRRTDGTTTASGVVAGFTTAAGVSGLDEYNGAPGAAVSSIYPSNLYADLTTASAVNVNDVRRAFALQRYQEARAQYGSRYTEYLRYIGVRSSDARLQRPEYLGGGKQTISFSEVLQSGPGATSVVGELKGHGISAMRSRRYRRFFEEHGFVISLMSVRPRTMYSDGLTRMWTRDSREDYFQRELELIGQQEVLNKEVYAFGASPEGVFGYNDRYYDYRHIPSGISGEFRSSLLNFWHLARLFGAAPTLNQAFIECVPSKRINAVQTNDVLWVMVNHSIQARRMVGKRTIGKIV